MAALTIPANTSLENVEIHGDTRLVPSTQTITGQYSNVTIHGNLFIPQEIAEQIQTAQKAGQLKVHGATTITNRTYETYFPTTLQSTVQSQQRTQ